MTHGDNLRRALPHRKPYTHCINRHVITPENTTTTGTCRTCKNAANRAYKARKQKESA